MITRSLRKFGLVRKQMRHHAGTHGVTPGRQIGEMMRLWAHSGIGPLEYYVLGLFRPSIPWSEKLNFVSDKTFYKLINQINPPHLRTVATNKVVSYGMLRTFGIPTPTIHGILGPDGQTTDGGPLRSTGDLAALIAAHGLRDVCFKPLSAWSGQGFLKVRIDGDEVTIQPDGPTVSVAAFHRDHLGGSGHGDYVIQDVLEQHPDVAALHPDSLNTMRVWMYQRRPGEWEMGPGNLRIGVGGSAVDNTSAGGIGAVIDNDSGRLGPAVIRALDPANDVMFQEYPVHPTTGTPIDGAQLPMWDQARELCRRTCAVFPFFRVMGLDVAWGLDHPWIIEVEADPHAMIQVYVGKGIGPVLRELAENAKREGHAR